MDAQFNLGIDSRLRGCDLMQLRVWDVGQGGRLDRIGAAETGLVLVPEPHQVVAASVDAADAKIVDAWVACGR